MWGQGRGCGGSAGLPQTTPRWSSPPPAAVPRGYPPRHVPRRRGALPQSTRVVLRAHGDEVWFVAFSHSGRYLATAGKDHRCCLFETDQWALPDLPVRIGHSSFAPPPGGIHRMFPWLPLCCVRVMPIAPTPAEPLTLRMIALARIACRPRPDGFRTICRRTNPMGSQPLGGFPPLWTDTGRSPPPSPQGAAPATAPWRTLEGHTDAVSYVAWSPDDALLVTCSQDCSCRVWNPRAPAAGGGR